MLTSLLAAQASDGAYPYCKGVHEVVVGLNQCNSVCIKQSLIQDKGTTRILTDEEYEEIKERERNLEKGKDDILV